MAFTEGFSPEELGESEDDEDEEVEDEEEDEEDEEDDGDGDDDDEDSETNESIKEKLSWQQRRKLLASMTLKVGNEEGIRSKKTSWEDR